MSTGEIILYLGAGFILGRFSAQAIDIWGGDIWRWVQKLFARQH